VLFVLIRRRAASTLLSSGAFWLNAAEQDYIFSTTLYTLPMGQSILWTGLSLHRLGTIYCAYHVLRFVWQKGGCLLYRPVPSHGPSVMLRVCLFLVAVISLRPIARREKTCSLPLFIIGRPDACSTSSPTPVSLTFSPVISSQVSSLNRTGRCGCSTPSGDLSSPTPSWQPTTFFIFPRRL
jgi:hypothetical protein